MQAGAVSAVVAVPRMRDVFLDLLGVHRIHRVHRAQVATEHHAARVLERLHLAVALGGKLAVAHVVGQSAAILRPVFVERGHRKHIGDIHLVDKLIRLIDQLRNQIQSLGVDRRHFIHVDGAGNAADQVVRVRVLAAEHRVDLDDFLLPHQRVQVVSHGDKVHLRRQYIGRMPPVAVGKDTQPVGGEGLDLVLHL